MQLVHRVSTFKHVPEEEEPLTKTETPGLETSPEGDEKKAPLGEGEDSTDDELGKTSNFAISRCILHLK